MRKKTTLLIFFIFIIKIGFFAQVSIKKPFIIGSKVHYGKILPHSESIRELAKANPWGVELNINWLNISDKSVKQCDCYSRTGIGLSYFDFDNPENRFFSSHIGFILLLDLNLRYKLSNNLDVITFGSFNHISNGGIKQPNVGMNWPTVGIGFDYNFSPVTLNAIPKTRINDKEKVTRCKFEFMESLKVQNKTVDYDEKVCFIYGFSVYANRRISKYSALNAGLEWVSDGWIKEGLKRSGIEMDHRKAAFLVGYDLMFGNFDFTIQLGVYFYNPHKTMDEVYQKYMLQYKFSKMFCAGVYMKTHRHVAEIIGVNFGLAF